MKKKIKNILQEFLYNVASLLVKSTMNICFPALHNRKIL